MNNNERIMLSSQAISLSEAQTYIELTNRLCYYGEKNLNNFILPVETAEEKAQTLLNMPVVAKYKKIRGKDDLGGHECYYDPIDKEVKFGTENVGTHIDVKIAEDTVVTATGEIKTLPCLFATSRIWKRNKNVVNAIKRLFAEGKLYTSWELIVNSFTFEDGVETAGDYVFTSNALLGSEQTPAYPCAETLNVASLNESATDIIDALTEDMKNKNTQERDMANEIVTEEIATEETVETAPAAEVAEESMANDVAEPEAEEVVAEAETEVIEETPEEVTETSEVETSAMTSYDLRKAIQQACRAKIDKWCWISFWFPEEHQVWCEYEDRESELNYYLFQYEVVDNEVTVSDPTDVTLTVNISEVNKTIADKDEALVEANKTIQELNDVIATLKPYKEQVEQAEREAQALQEETERKELSDYALSSGHITQNELDNDETIKAYIAERNKDAIKSIIADRFMASLKIQRNEPQHMSSATVNLEDTTPSIKPKKSIVEMYIGE